MSIGKSIYEIRTEKELSQEEFGELFHVTRQTVSNWEREKSYPDLETIIGISDRFEISLDQLLKEDRHMVKTMDKERLHGTYVKKQHAIIDFFTGSGTGIVISCLFALDSPRRTIAFGVGVAMILIGWLKKSKCDKAVIGYLESRDKEE